MLDVNIHKTNKVVLAFVLAKASANAKKSNKIKVLDTKKTVSNSYICKVVFGFLIDTYYIMNQRIFCYCFPIFVYDIPETFPITYVAVWVFSHVLLAVS